MLNITENSTFKIVLEYAESETNSESMSRNFQISKLTGNFLVAISLYLMTGEDTDHYTIEELLIKTANTQGLSKPL